MAMVQEISREEAIVKSAMEAKSTLAYPEICLPSFMN